MNNKTIRLRDKCSVYKPLGDRVLVEPMKELMSKQFQMTREPVLDKNGKQKMIKPTNDELRVGAINDTPEWAMFEQMVKLPNKYQRAVMLQLPKNEVNFEIGDTIIYTQGSLTDFDLIKGVSVIRKYNDVAVA